MCFITATELVTVTHLSDAISVLISMVDCWMFRKTKLYCQKFEAEVKIICVEFRFFFNI